MRAAALRQVLQGCSDAQLQQHWQECATLAALRFDWKDQAEPLAAAQAAAYALHYYPPHQVGCASTGVTLGGSACGLLVARFIKARTTHGCL
jgi:hypothetical protein